MKQADLRSDTVTRPGAEMRRLMAAARVGDVGYQDDPTVAELERECARLSGKEAALFMPSGTMANLASLLAITPRGSLVVCERSCHTLGSEMSGAVLVGGMVAYPVDAPSGIPSEEDLANASYAMKSIAPAMSIVLLVEQTHNSLGGLVLSTDEVDARASSAKARGAKVHMDGSRIFNASVAAGLPVRTLAGSADSVSFCFSKGLTAPFGAAICASGATIENARRMRKMLGGGMRQAGIMAAAALYGLEHMVDRLREDHARAKALALALAGIDARFCDPDRVMTNIINVGVGWTGRDAAWWVARLESRGVLVKPKSRFDVRIVLHADVGDEAVEIASNAFAGILADGGTSS